MKALLLCWFLISCSLATKIKLSFEDLCRLCEEQNLDQDSELSQLLFDDYRNKRQVPQIQKLLAQHIKTNAKVLSYMLGISTKAPLITSQANGQVLAAPTEAALYGLTGAQFRSLIQYLKANLFAEPSLKAITEILGYECTPELKAHLQDFLERARIVKDLDPSKRKFLPTHADILYYNELGGNFSEQLSICRTLSLPKLAFIRRVFNDSRFQDFFKKPWDKEGIMIMRGLIEFVRKFDDKKFLKASYNAFTEGSVAYFRDYQEQVNQKQLEYLQRVKRNQNYWKNMRTP